jgi:hypothetical protein
MCVEEWKRADGRWWGWRGLRDVEVVATFAAHPKLRDRGTTMGVGRDAQRLKISSRRRTVADGVAVSDFACRWQLLYMGLRLLSSCPVPDKPID